MNAKLKFLYQQSWYLTSGYKRLLCNVLIQPHFDYRFSLWFPLLEKNLKLKLQKAQNKHICFCLNLPLRSHINPLHFRKINWLPTSDRVESVLQIPFLSTRMELHHKIFMEMFKPSQCRYSTRSQMALDIPLLKTNTWEKKLVFLMTKDTVNNKL